MNRRGFLGGLLALFGAGKAAAKLPAPHPGMVLRTVYTSDGGERAYVRYFGQKQWVRMK